MIAPLHFPVPEGTTVEQLDPPRPMLGWHLRDVLVAHVRVGDFTTFTGYRRVYDVEVVTETRGRGSKRATTLVGYRLFYHDDTTGVLFAPDAVLKRVYAHG